MYCSLLVVAKYALQIKIVRCKTRLQRRGRREYRERMHRERERDSRKGSARGQEVPGTLSREQGKEVGFGDMHDRLKLESLRNLRHVHDSILVIFFVGCEIEAGCHDKVTGQKGK